MDPVSDFIIRLKNAGMAGKKVVSAPYSKLLHNIADTLLKHNFIASVEKRGKKTRKELEVKLLYEEDGSPRIHDIDRVSKPSRRVYRGVKEMRKVRGGRGALILSTPKGVLTGAEAKKEGVGGEALFKIW